MSSPKDIQRGESESIERRLLLEAVFLKYGYDFRDYAQPSLRRRIARCLKQAGAANISELQHMVLHDPSALESLLLTLTINVTEMFRDPQSSAP